MKNEPENPVVYLSKLITKSNYHYIVYGASKISSSLKWEFGNSCEL